MKKAVLALFAFVALATGCTSDKYTWNQYDDNLYAYYKNPEQKQKFVEHLKETIALGEAKNNLAPGIYAEYAYLLYEMQNFSEAIIYFQKERDLYPEAQFFMAKMVDNSQKMLNKGQIVVVSQ
jgi:hypothetical protein